MHGFHIGKLRAISLLTVGFASATALFCAHDGNAQSAAVIIKKSVSTNTADWKAQPEYSYCERDVKTKIYANRQAKLQQSRTFEVTMIEGSPYYRLIGIDNEPLTRTQQQQEQIKLNREVGHRQKETRSERQARLSKYQSERTEEHLLMQQMVDAFNFRLAGQEQINGFDCYVFDATPNPNYRPPSEKARVLTGMEGRLWIEKSGFHWAKVQAHITSPVQFALFIASVKPGTSFELEQAPVGDVWLPKHFIENLNASVLGLYGMRSKEEEQYSGYHRMLLTASTSTPVN